MTTCLKNTVILLSFFSKSTASCVYTGSFSFWNLSTGVVFYEYFIIVVLLFKLDIV